MGKTDAGRELRHAPGRGALRLAMVCLCMLPRLAAAQTQVSDEFVRVARELGKRVTSDELARICDGLKQVDARPICKSITKSVAPLFEMAIDRKVDERALSGLLVDLETNLAQSAAAHAAEGLLRDTLRDAFAEVQTDDPECAASLRTDAAALSQCLVAQVLPARVGEADDTCRRVADGIAAMGKACNLALPALPRDGKVDLAALLDALRSGIESLPGTSPGAGGQRYRALVVLTSVERLLEGRSDLGSVYAAVAKASEVYDTAFSFVGDVNREHVTAASRIASDLAALEKTQCDHAAATARLKRWQGDRARVFHELATSLVAARAPDDAALGAIPTDVPDVACPAAATLSKPDEDAQLAIARVRRSAVTYRTDVLLVSRLDRLVLPALLAAALIDYLRTSDVRGLQSDLRDVALRLFARVLAGVDARAYSCAGGSPYTCTSVDGQDVQTLTLPAGTNAPDDVVGAVFEARYSPASARQTCLYQAVAAMFQQPVEGAGVCRLTTPLTSVDLSRAISRLLQTLPRTGNQLAQWDASMIVPLANGRSKLSLLAKLDVDEAFSFLGGAVDEVVPTLTASTGLRMPSDAGPVVVARAVVSFAHHAVEHREGDGTRAMLMLAASDLRPLLDDLLDDFLGVNLACADGKDATTLRCGTRILAGAVYAPVVEYLAIPNPTEADRQRLSREAYRKVLELDVLSRTPVLFNVGLGFTALSRGGTTTHLTLLDKIGVVSRWGTRNEWEAGGFVGGFLDAIVRAATDSADARPYWMIGGTIGRRSLAASLPLGVEGHLGAALPFDPAKFKDRAALAAGVTLIVPADVVFGK